MNYEYIEQLIERYFSCQTTVQEEQILRSFFVGEDVPGHLMQYADLFKYEEEAHKETLGSDFDEKMLHIISQKENKTSATRKQFVPFFRAAAVVAIVLTVGSAAETAIGDSNQTDVPNTQISPYIRKVDIQATIKTHGVNQAEAKSLTDSLLVQPVDDKVQ